MIASKLQLLSVLIEIRSISFFIWSQSRLNLLRGGSMSLSRKSVWATMWTSKRESASASRKSEAILFAVSKYELNNTFFKVHERIWAKINYRFVSGWIPAMERVSSMSTRTRVTVIFWTKESLRRAIWIDLNLNRAFRGFNKYFVETISHFVS